ncbi:hypothetical protein BJX76DRAFT_339157 [Aspergillus varians]
MNPTETGTATAIMSSLCPPAEATVALGFFGTIWAAISGFFGTIGSIIGACLKVFFGTLLPAVIAILVVIAVPLFLYGFVVELVKDTSLASWWEKTRKEGQEERKEDDIEGLSSGDIGSDEEIIDVADGRRRVEIEIEFLEELLRAKREKLEAL